MGSLGIETENACSETYLRLGLRESRKETSEIPRVLSYISLFLERSIQKNERYLETTQTKDIMTIFHGTKAPPLSIGQYIDRIFKYSYCSPSCFVVAHIYVERFIQLTSALVTSLNVHRLLITSIMVAAKFVDDAFFNNAYYARVGGVSTSELNRLEMKFLFGLDFRLYVSKDTFGKYCMLLEKESTNSGFQIERPIQACGIVKGNWSSKEDSSCAKRMASLRVSESSEW
ncbi:OLC1v1007307C1 [Oldenlandia corymbosa var. corymbosa]|uniref:OLC1v1007307C1 n=1 Tax=Oldenlandia corymbosa var. corymbosa TaxID=529605 RepID=A0AAV1DJK5_OLDCO|nr:OLC1v1007307C1 [Oldenlandia corymbosa var. corymbosa]